MNQQELETKMLDLAKRARDAMIANQGSLHQLAVLYDLEGFERIHVMENGVLHGKEMSEFFLVAMKLAGGADAFVVCSDARYETGQSPERAAEIRRAAQQGRYLIADNPQAQEAIILFGRSHEHTAVIAMPYDRDGDKVRFHQAEPEINRDLSKMRTGMIPNIWEHEN